MKMVLVATTALVSVSSALAGPLPSREPVSGPYGLSANDTFLCDYGAFDINFKLNFAQSGVIEHWTRAAVPVRGNGEEVGGIEIADKFYSSGYPGLSIGIYTSRHNMPFKQLTSTRTVASGCPLTVSVGPIQLQQGKKYWVVEKTAPSFGDLSIASGATWGYAWFYRTTKARDALSQSGSSICSGSRAQFCYPHYHTAWAPITAGTPYVKLMSTAPARKSSRVQTGGPVPDHGNLDPIDPESGTQLQPASKAMGNRSPP